jgi:hypothetical protein
MTNTEAREGSSSYHISDKKCQRQVKSVRELDDINVPVIRKTM